MEYVKSKAQAYKETRGYKEKQEIAIATVKHFADQNKRFFGYDATSQVRLMSSEGTLELVKLALRNARSNQKR